MFERKPCTATTKGFDPMSIPLRQAREAADNADIAKRPTDPADELVFAQMYSLLSIAESLSRIADALERKPEQWAVVDGLNQRVD